MSEGQRGRHANNNSEIHRQDLRDADCQQWSQTRDKAAILWDPAMLNTNCHDDHHKTSNYWRYDDGDASLSSSSFNHRWVQCYIKGDNNQYALFSNDVNHKNETTNDAVAPAAVFHGISYAAYNEITYRVALKLRQKIVLSLEMKNSTNVFRSPHPHATTEIPFLTIVVAIPEGLYLPLAIATVYTLQQQQQQEEEEENQQLDVDSNPATRRLRHERLPAIVLVPLDPTEGKERVAYMIRDSQPTLILGVGGYEDKDNLFFGALGQANENPERMVDFPSLVQECVAEMNKNKKQNGTITTTTSTASTKDIDDRMDDENDQNDDIQDKYKKEKQPEYLEGVWYYLNQRKHQLTQQSFSRRQKQNTVSHMVYTSGTTGRPKACLSSTNALHHYLYQKNQVHHVHSESTVLLASSLSFDPCFSDVLATAMASASLVIVPRHALISQLPWILSRPQSSLRMGGFGVTHILCTPTVWTNGMMMHRPSTSTATTRSRSANGWTRYDFPQLQVIALGGEPIPRQIRQLWARRNCNEDNDGEGPKVLTTYGVTEACVYQTAGEVFQSDDSSNHERGQDVGQPFCGLGVKICRETSLEDLDSSQEYPHNVGEIVLYGQQIDFISCYYYYCDHSQSGDNNSLVSQQQSKKFIRVATQDHTTKGEPKYCYYYRTGDLGYWAASSSSSNSNNQQHSLRILGRIASERGMVKINGIRVELGEIEQPLRSIGTGHYTTSDPKAVPNVDNELVLDCMVVGERPKEEHDDKVQNDHHEQIVVTKLVAYIVLRSDCLQELSLVQDDGNFPKEGLLLGASGVGTGGGGPLYLLFREHCRRCCRVVPNWFILLSRIPTSPTGKRTNQGLPSPSQAIPIQHYLGRGADNAAAIPLHEYGSCGAFIAAQIVDCLNLPQQQSSSASSIIVTTDATLDLLGGDSLAATRIVRALYSHYYGLENTRFLGGAHGILDDDRFSPWQLIRTPSLGQYVDYMDRVTNGAFQQQSAAPAAQPQPQTQTKEELEEDDEKHQPEQSAAMTKQGTITTAIPFTKNNNGSEKTIDQDRHGNGNDVGPNHDHAAAVSVSPASNTDNNNNNNTYYDGDTTRFVNEALLEASMRGYVSVAVALLLDLDADPNDRVANLQKHRLGKTTSRLERKQVFVSTPLHYACLQGEPKLVQALLHKGAKTTAPDASGAFPIHLAASGGSNSRGRKNHPSCGVEEGKRNHHDNIPEIGRGEGIAFSSSAAAAAATSSPPLNDGNVNTTTTINKKAFDSKKYWECVRLLLDEGQLPLTMKDGNRQTILHTAARGGQDYIVIQLLKRWREEMKQEQEQQDEENKESSAKSHKASAAGAPANKRKRQSPSKSQPKSQSRSQKLGNGKEGFLEWRDRWSRTAVHWAVLNGQLRTLQILLEAGALPDPVLPKKNKSSSVALERPIDLCDHRRLLSKQPRRSDGDDPGGNHRNGPKPCMGQDNNDQCQTNSNSNNKNDDDDDDDDDNDDHRSQKNNPVELGLAMKQLLLEYMNKQ